MMSLLQLQVLLLLIAAAFRRGNSFTIKKAFSGYFSVTAERREQHDRRRHGIICRSSSEPIEVEVPANTLTANDGSNPLGLTPELAKIVTAFERIGDDKLRYKQLLYMANQLPSFDPAKQIPENKVPGCLSTVYIDGHAELINDEYIINFVGDSDGLLTKGLVSLLVRGLSGNTASEIQKVDPTFINTAGIATSLTPGRNNGFLNMLAVIKRKAIEIETAAKSRQSTTTSTTSSLSSADDGRETGSDRPMYDAILNALQALKPEKVELVDTSYQHAGHAGAKGSGQESHFELYIVAEAFDGLNLIKRHKLVYMMLSDIMPKIHALNIKAKTPQELQQ